MNLNNKLTFATVALANFAANAAIGTAAATVDITPCVSIPQTTAGITLTLPTPTISEIGQHFTVLNTGTASVTVGGASIASGFHMTFMWTGAAWLPLPTGGSTSAMVGSTSAAAGTAGTVPTPAAGTQNQYLTGGATYTSSIPSWVAAKAYTAGDIVYDPTSNKIYRRITTGTSLGTFALDTANWQELSASAAATAMTGATSAAAGTGGTTPTPAAGSQFQFLTGGATYTSAIPSWLAATAYTAGDIVYDPTSNKIYRRITTGTSLGTFALDTANWQELSASSSVAMVGSTSAAAGTGGTTPTPAAGTQNQFLTGGATYTNAIPSWVTAKAYAVGDEVYDPATNLIYRRTTAGTSLGTFALDAANWQLMGGGVTTASNGLTLSTNDVQLGGTLTKNTTIAQAGFTFNLTNTTGVATGVNMSNLNGSGYIDVEATGNININSDHRIQFLTNGTTRAEILNAGTFLIEGPGPAGTSGLRFTNIDSSTTTTATGALLGVDATGNVIVMAGYGNLSVETAFAANTITAPAAGSTTTAWDATASITNNTGRTCNVYFNTVVPNLGFAIFGNAVATDTDYTLNMYIALGVGAAGGLIFYDYIRRGCRPTNGAADYSTWPYMSQVRQVATLANGQTYFLRFKADLVVNATNGNALNQFFNSSGIVALWLQPI